MQQLTPHLKTYQVLFSDQERKPLFVTKEEAMKIMQSVNSPDARMIALPADDGQPFFVKKTEVKEVKPISENDKKLIQNQAAIYYRDTFLGKGLTASDEEYAVLKVERKYCATEEIIETFFCISNLKYPHIQTAPRVSASQGEEMINKYRKQAAPIAK